MAAHEKKQDKKSEAKLVRMVRDPEIYPEPHTADVHPDEVENVTDHGWRVE